MTLEIRNEKLYVNGKAIGDEERLFIIFDKAIKYDEVKASFEELKQENARLTQKLQNVTLWDLSEAEQERAGRALARSLTGGA